MGNKIKYYKAALEWIKCNTLNGNGITVTSKKKVIYPEVTGYYIPTLLQHGERKLAIQYARYLCSIQKKDGSWSDPTDSNSYVFDSAQILKGLLAVREFCPEVESNILKGCEWIVSNIRSDGRLVTPDQGAWGDDEEFCSELVHIYCLSPLKHVGELFGIPIYVEAANKVLEYYKREKMESIINFSLLSHFYAYIMEGLYDLGEVDLCRKAMLRLEQYRNHNGAIPGLKDVPWVCSTGLFQLALVWYKLGEMEKGNSLFYNALNLQNKSGGWYGSYRDGSIFSFFYTGRNKPFYFPDEEISWANKYFFDALALKEKLEFEKVSHIFSELIEGDDGRLCVIEKEVGKQESLRGGQSLSICDVGCGKGRYLKHLVNKYPKHAYYASDISFDVMKNIDFVTDKKVGFITNIPYKDDMFDLVYTCEAYEHSLNLHGAFLELYRIVKPGGCLIIIDKPVEKLGKLKIYEWEQWISDSDIKSFSDECGGDLNIIPSVSYEGKDDGLFRAWVVRKNEK